MRLRSYPSEGLLKAERAKVLMVAGPNGRSWKQLEEARGARRQSLTGGRQHAEFKSKCPTKSAGAGVSPEGGLSLWLCGPWRPCMGPHMQESFETNFILCLHHEIISTFQKRSPPCHLVLGGTSYIICPACM